MAVRLAHKAVTLGELSIIVFGATSLYIELVNVTISRVRKMPLLAFGCI